MSLLRNGCQWGMNVQATNLFVVRPTSIARLALRGRQHFQPIVSFCSH